MRWGGMRWDGEERCVPPSPAPFMRKRKIAKGFSTSGSHCSNVGCGEGVGVRCCEEQLSPAGSELRCWLHGRSHPSLPKLLPHPLLAVFLPRLHGTPPSSACSAKLFAWPSCASSRNWLSFTSPGERLFFFWLRAVMNCSLTNGHQHSWWFRWSFSPGGVKTMSEVTGDPLVWAVSLSSCTHVLPLLTAVVASGDTSSELRGNTSVCPGALRERPKGVGGGWAAGSFSRCCRVGELLAE